MPFTIFAYAEVMEMTAMNFAAEIAPLNGMNRRQSARERVSIGAKLLADGLQRSLCKVEDLSRTGARLQTYSGLKPKSDIALVIPNIGVRAAKVIWANDFAAGLQFYDPLNDQEFDRALGE